MLQVRGVKGVFLANQKIDGKVTTLITYNKGRDWDFLNPPDMDMNGKPTNCKPVSGSFWCILPLKWARIICMVRCAVVPAAQELCAEFTSQTNRQMYLHCMSCGST